ncbi:MAG: helix-turn-helix domain-containing protein [Candidatus Tectomicrobia bacterium]|nr:helix-turn-helix domain-containing protein [Candidatus Tectomicrobia bacterium]
MLNLYQAILAEGGIRSYRNGHLKEELQVIPLCLRRRRGLPLDEMIDTLRAYGFWFESESDLLDAIARYRKTAEDLPPKPEREFPTLREVQRHHLQTALDKTGGNIRQAAQLLDVPYVSMQRHVKRYRLRTASNSHVEAPF